MPLQIFTSLLTADSCMAPTVVTIVWYVSALPEMACSSWWALPILEGSTLGTSAFIHLETGSWWPTRTATTWWFFDGTDARGSLKILAKE
ncbi:unnamed protein product [Durusdinium trenchii]|uniref:Secreted protein n=1 Tax=Durusdinium trenchii TaxID=1381693 RepID=A0ABP0KLS5_9DINO